MKEKRKYETPKVEVLEVELRDAIASQSCARDVAIYVNRPTTQKNETVIEDIGGTHGTVSWDDF